MSVQFSDTTARSAATSAASPAPRDDRPPPILETYALARNASIFYLLVAESVHNHAQGAS